MAYGYWGKILVVDLSTGEIKEEHPEEEVYKHYLGGYGLGVYYLYQHIPKMADPLGPDNILGIIPGLLTGSGAQFSGRFMVVARSPLTGAWADANCGGDFGVALRGAGWDGLFIRGISQHPVYLYIIGEQVKICDASPLWGLDAVETEHAIQQALGKDVRVACIGPAGEHLSLISGIVNDEGRLAARGGLGAVMGSKRLKAIAARGNRRPPQASPHSFKAVTTPYLQIFKQPTSRWISRVPGILTRLLPFMRRLRVRLSSAPGKLVIDSFRRYGTAAGTSALIELGDTPVRNWSGIGYRDFPIDEAEKLSGEAVIRPAVRAYACHSCPVACGAIVRINDQQSGHKPEYESLAAFGPLLMVSDLESVMHCNHLCNNAGLDVISTGVAIAFALECAENGWLPDELANELPLGWGDGQVIAELIERIIRRQAGLGDWLADGVQHAAQTLNNPVVQEAAIHAGGQELPMHRGIFEPSLALAYQVDPAPGRHTATAPAELPVFTPFLEMDGRKPAGRYDYSAKGPVQAIIMATLRAYDSLGMCQFAFQMSDPPLIEWVNAITGWQMNHDEFFRVGKRIQVMRHAFNARHGLPAQFPLPARERGDPPQPLGPVANRTLDMNTMAAGYFKFLGVDPSTGKPLPETVKELGLEDIYDE